MSNLWLSLKRRVMDSQIPTDSAAAAANPTNANAATPVGPNTEQDPDPVNNAASSSATASAVASDIPQQSKTANHGKAWADPNATTSTEEQTATQTTESEVVKTDYAPAAVPTADPSPGLGTTTTSSSTTLAPDQTTTSALMTTTTDTTNAETGAYSGGGDSTKTKLAIALPIAIVGLLVGIGLVFFYLRRRRRQRIVPPTYEIAASQITAVSASEFMAIPKIATPEPAAGLPRAPVLDVPANQDREPSPGSATARSPDDSHTELGLAVAVPMDQRMSATEHDLRGLSRANSGAGVGTPGTPGIRLPFQNHDGDADDDAVSVVSDRGHTQDFDDMSSVSSFNDETPRNEHHAHSFR